MLRGVILQDNIAKYQKEIWAKNDRLKVLFTGWILKRMISFPLHITIDFCCNVEDS